LFTGGRLPLRNNTVVDYTYMLQMKLAGRSCYFDWFGKLPTAHAHYQYRLTGNGFKGSDSEATHFFA
jgi:hypothetical protein